MQHKIMGAWFVAGMLVLLLPGLSCAVQAGGINSAEQKVINAASGTFSYQGKTYAVKDRYIAAGRSKLAEDGIDLSDADANSYIAQFRNSYEELIEGGYCEEVGGQSSDAEEGKDSDSSEADKNAGKGDTGKDSDSSKADKDAGKDSDSSKADKDAGKDAAGTEGQGGKSQTDQASENKNNEQAHSTAEKAKNQLFIRTVLGESEDESRKEDDSNAAESVQVPTDADWLEEEDLGTTVDFEEKDLKAAKEQTLNISGAGNHYQIQKQKQEKTVQTDNMISQILSLKQWKIISIVILAVALCCAAAIGCYIWVVLRRHHKKRKLRLGLAIAAGASVAGCAFLFMLVIGLYFGVYNREAIHRQLMESDYYSGITQMTRKLAAEELREAGCDEGIATEVFTLSHVYIEEKQYINAILAGRKNSAVSTENIQRVLEEQIPDTIGEQKDTLVSSITDLYQNTLQFELGETIWESRQAFLPWCYGTAAASVFMLLVLLILTYQMYGYLHKSVRVCSVGILASSLFIAGTALVLRLQHYAGRFHVEPVYYQQFIQKYVNWSVNVMLYVGCIGVLVAVALAVWKRYLHMIYVD